MAVQWQPQQGMKHWDSGTFLAFQKWLKLLRKQILSHFLASIASADAKNENNKTSCKCLAQQQPRKAICSVCYGCLLLSYAFKLDFGERIKNIQVAGETWLSYTYLWSLSKLGITNETVLADWGWSTHSISCWATFLQICSDFEFLSFCGNFFFFIEGVALEQKEMISWSLHDYPWI